MVFAAIMAGGAGTRMGCGDVPKQFLPLGGKPILVRTVNRFLAHEQVDRAVILCPGQWIGETERLLREQCPGAQGRAFVLAGGSTRNETLQRGVERIGEMLPAGEDAVILTHDAVRPFVTARIISENIAAARKYGACGTVVPATDTISVSRDGRFIDETPDRSCLFHSQTPQSFLLSEYRKAVGSAAGEDSEKITDACMLFNLAGKRVFMVRGEQTNIKITWPGDLATAEAILKTVPDED